MTTRATEIELRQCTKIWTRIVTFFCKCKCEHCPECPWSFKKREVPCSSRFSLSHEQHGWGAGWTCKSFTFFSAETKFWSSHHQASDEKATKPHQILCQVKDVRCNSGAKNSSLGCAHLLHRCGDDADWEIAGFHQGLTLWNTKKFSTILKDCQIGVRARPKTTKPVHYHVMNDAFSDGC